MANLFDGEDSNFDETLKINTKYATNYNEWRQKEEFNKLKTKYGEHLNELNSNDEESTSSSEDEDANCLTEKCEEGFYKTLSHLEKKDPVIYDDKVDFFAALRNADDSETENIGHSPKKTKKSKKQSLYLRDYERKIISEHGGKFSDSEEEETQRIRKDNETVTVPYVEEQRQILESIKQGSKIVDDDNEIFKVKPKPDKQVEIESDEELTEGKSKKDMTKRRKSKPVHDERNDSTDPNLTSEEKFLRDYVLNNKFLDVDSANGNGFNYDIHEADEIFSEDEKFIEENQEFEHKYNYRFEEPDQDFIKRYPRTMEDTLRKKDTRRAQKRAEVKKRKEEEKIRQKEELKQLKALKRKEIMDKLTQLKEITGNNDMKLDIIDLDGDFDPAEHDRKMQELFNEEYYNADENVKPEFPELDEELGIESTWDTYDPNTEEIATISDDYVAPTHCEDAEFNMDADYDDNKSLQNELAGASRKKRRRRTKFSDVIAKEKPKFDPNIHSSFKDYIDQYYALDYEDMIGDLPCRFKYRSVVPNDYGLSVEEILMADDKELNKWCSLKKALEHKSEQMEMNEVQMFKQKGNNEAYKKKILQSLYKPKDETDDGEGTSSTAKALMDTENRVDENANKKKRKPKKKKRNVEIRQAIITGTSEEVMKVQEKSEGNIELAPNKKEKKQLKRPAIITNTATERVDHKDEAKISETQNKRRKIDESALVKGKGTEKKLNGQTEKTISKKLQRKIVFQQRQQDLKKQTENNSVALLSDERLKAYKINPRKFKNKLKYGVKN